MRGSPTFLAALLAAVSLPVTVTAGAAPPRCAHADPRGDVLLAGQVPVDAPQVDLVSYDLVLGRKEVVAVIRTADGGPGNARWTLTVSSGKETYYFAAIRSSEPVNDPRTPYDDTSHVEYLAFAGTGPNLRATGSISPSGEVRIRVPLTAYGRKPPRGGELRDYLVWSYTRTTSPTGGAEIRDEAASAC